MAGSMKNALVTGGTDGVGKEVARGLARAGHRVVLVGRDADKGARVEREIREMTGNAEVQFLQADLSLVREANRLTDEIAGRWPALHYLVHSAGVVRGRRELTVEGIESNFAINYLLIASLPSRHNSNNKGSLCSLSQPQTISRCKMPTMLRA